jgi:hypothetical protein
MPEESGPKKTGRRLFYSPGLTWPFFAAVACLIMMWTEFWAVNARRLELESDPLGHGIIFGLLSGVVLFAIMRAFDRSRN